LAPVQSNLTRNIQPHSVILEFPTLYFTTEGAAVAHLIQARRHKPEGRGFDSRWGHGIFH